MANKQQLFQALNAARSAANDTTLPEQKQNKAKQRAAQIATMIKEKVGQQREQLQGAAGQIRTPGSPITPQQQEQRLQQDIERAERPENRGQTRAARNLPELFESGILRGQNPAKVAQFAALASLTPDPRELADIATNMFPDLGVQEDPGGNILLGNNQTGVQAIINRPGVSGTDLAQFFGGMAAFSPAGRASTLAAPAAKQGVKQASKGAAAAGGTQAGIEGFQSGSGGQFNPEQVGMAAVLDPAIGAGQTAFRVARGGPSQKTRDVLRSGEREGVDVITTDIAAPKSAIGGLVRQFAERFPGPIGTGSLRKGQKEARESVVQEIADSVPPTNDRAIIKSLKSKKDRIKAAAGSRYERITQQMDQAGEFVPSNTLAEIDKAIAELTKRGRVPDSGSAQTLMDLRTALREPQTFSLLKENRTDISDLINTISSGERSQMPTKAKSILTRVKNAMTKDMDEFVKDVDPNALPKYKQADAIYREEAKRLTKSRIKNVLDKGDMTPESYETLLFSNKPSEQRNLYQSLTNDGRANARTAIMNRMIQRAGGVDDITPGKFSKELKKNESAINIFFKGEERDRLIGLRRLLEATKRADESAVITPTGQSQNVPQAVGLVGGAINDAKQALKIVGGLTVGTASRIYETKPVRDLMIRLKDAPRGSAAENRILSRLGPALTAATQSVIQQQTQQRPESQTRQIPVPEAL